MNKNIIYHFSGTGNSLNAAIEIAKKLSSTDVISMRCNPEDVPASKAKIIGFIFPVYHWSLPTDAIDFIKKLTINPSAYIFAISSCGGWSMNSLNDFSDIIKAKGGIVSYSAVYKCVANYVAEYEPFPAPSKQLPKSERELKQIISEIMSKTLKKAPKKTLRKEILRIIEKPFVRSLPQKDRHFNVSSDCVSCGICAQICMVHNIELKNSTPIFKHNCAQCMACIVFCPKSAINYKNKTQKRTKYHHPNISAALMIKDIQSY